MLLQQALAMVCGLALSKLGKTWKAQNPSPCTRYRQGRGWPEGRTIGQPPIPPDFQRFGYLAMYVLLFRPLYLTCTCLDAVDVARLIRHQLGGGA
jgi:hypothetical protein